MGGGAGIFYATKRIELAKGSGNGTKAKAIVAYVV